MNRNKIAPSVLSVMALYGGFGQKLMADDGRQPISVDPIGGTPAVVRSQPRVQPATTALPTIQELDAQLAVLERMPLDDVTLPLKAQSLARQCCQARQVERGERAWNVAVAAAKRQRKFGAEAMFYNEWADLMSTTDPVRAGQFKQRVLDLLRREQMPDRDRTMIYQALIDYYKAHGQSDKADSLKPEVDEALVRIKKWYAEHPCAGCGMG